MERPRVLCVDDEPNVLSGLALHLRKDYDVATAASGALGLAAFESQGPFAVVLSDMRMPGMNGAEFLARSREASPDTVRMLLTGYADVEGAIAAVNDGQIFRFLTKPCPPDRLRNAFRAAADQYRLVTAERVLLEQTLLGSIKTLVDVLSLTSPMAFGRATRIKKLVGELADTLGLKERWHVEIAAMLSQLGHIVLPAETIEKLHYGKALEPREAELLKTMPQTTDRLLGNIPRLEVVRGILAKALGQSRLLGVNIQDTEQQVVETGGQMLRLALAYDELESTGLAPDQVLSLLSGRRGLYDSGMLAGLAAIRRASSSRETIAELAIGTIREGMILAEDLKTTDGTLLAARGYEVTAGFVERARHYRSRVSQEMIRVIVRNRDP